MRARIWLVLTTVLLALVVGCEVNIKVPPDVKSGAKKVAKALKPAGRSNRTGKSQSSEKTSGAKTSFVRTSPSPQMPARSADVIRVASFNIQVLGQSKLKKPGVADALAEVIRRFDVIAIQELRSKQQNVIPTLLNVVNASGVRYESVVGPRQGRTSSKEQYVFLFNTQVIEYLHNSAFIVPDHGELLHREPMVASFRVRQPPTGRSFTFTLVNIHTDPDETKTELDALGDAFRLVQSRIAPEDDVILLGDLNVNATKLGKLGQVPNITWTVRAEMTNTLRTKSYDNILFNRYSTAEFTGRSGVFDLERELGIDRRQALLISDHLPVWAEFQASEAGGVSVAGRPKDRPEKRK